jgi:lipoprotein LprG
MPRLRSLRALILLAALLAAALLVSGCGGSDSEKKAEKSPQQVMETAKQKFDDASSVQLELATKSTPSGGNGVLGATGVLTQDPAFKGDVKVVLNGLTATVPITSVDDKVYAKLPLQTKYTVIDPTEYGAPDPAAFADPSGGVSSLLTQLDGLEKKGETRSADEVLTTYTGTLPGKAVKSVIPSAAADQTYKTSVGVDEKGYARTVRITGTFFAGSDDVTYDLDLSDYDAGVKISAPTA